jgi:hypothetical protein
MARMGTDLIFMEGDARGEGRGALGRRRVWRPLGLVAHSVPLVCVPVQKFSERTRVPGYHNQRLVERFYRGPSGRELVMEQDCRTHAQGVNLDDKEGDPKCVEEEGAEPVGAALLRCFGCWSGWLTHDLKIAPAGDRGRRISNR